MTFATATATRAEAITLHDAAYNLSIALRQIKDGSYPASVNTGRFTPAQIDTLVSAVSAAITAANA